MFSEPCLSYPESGWLGLGLTEWAVLILMVTIVWMAEFLNAAIEAVINLASPELHPMAKVGTDVAADLAAAAVLLGAVASVLVGLLVLGPPLLEKLGIWR